MKIYMQFQCAESSPLCSEAQSKGGGPLPNIWMFCPGPLRPTWKLKPPFGVAATPRVSVYSRSPATSHLNLPTVTRLPLTHLHPATYNKLKPKSALVCVCFWVLHYTKHHTLPAFRLSTQNRAKPQNITYFKW